MHDAWFADEDQVRKTVGLLDKPVYQYSNAREVRRGCLGFKTGQLILNFLVICCLGFI